ncbi:MAG: hypothetical protein N2653_00915, partial [Burkholderiales bacterium]|nr:hypothetical protein [Burkholderiales bacterium]
HGSRRADQGEVWKFVPEKLASRGVHSATMAMADAYRSSARSLSAYGRGFRARVRQRGAVVALDGRVAGLALFDSAPSFARYLKKLVRSWALDAIETADGRTIAPAEAEASAFLDRIRRAAAERFPALGEGEDLRLSDEGIAGGALAVGGRVVHLAGYAVA